MNRYSKSGELMPHLNFMDSRLPERFWDRIAPCPMSGCWLWTGSVDPSGYGMYTRGRNQRAHQHTYVAANGELPAGLEIDHRTCRIKACCNPLHLEAVTHRENMRRSAAVRIYSDTCPHGHRYEARRPGSKKRICLVCVRASRTKYNHKVRGEPGSRPRQAPKTHCVNGHVFDEANTIHRLEPNGTPRRACRACKNAGASKRYFAKKKR